MRRLLLAVVLAAASASAAFAADDTTIASRFGNTVIVKGEFGIVHLYFNADHTFTGKVLPVNFGLKGSWKMDGDNLCLDYDPAPPGINNPACAPVAAHAVGDTWSASGRSATLVQGIQ